MRIHQSICYCKLVHATLSLKFGDSLKLSFFFEAFPSVFARTLACSFIHSLQLGFRFGLQLWRLWMCMRMRLYGECRKWKYFFLCVIFFSSFFIQLRLDYKAPKLQKLHLHVSESGRYRQASRYVRFHCTTTSVIQFPNCNEC